MKRQQLAGAIEALLKQFRSVNNLALSAGVSREAVTRMRRGYPARVDIVERFARNLSLDVNLWLSMNGYPMVADVTSEETGVVTLTEAKTWIPAPNGSPIPVTDPVQLATAFAEWLKKDITAREREFRPHVYFVDGVRRLVVAMGEKTPPLDASHLPGDNASREEVDELVKRIGQEMQAERDRRRGIKGGSTDASAESEPAPA